MHAWKIGLGVLGLAILGVGGYFANEAYQCHSHETDYLNAMAIIRGSLASASVVSDPQLSVLMEEQQEVAWKASEAALFAIYEHCGEQAGRTAHRKGQDMLMGLL